MVFDRKPTISIALPEMCVFEQLIFDNIWSRYDVDFKI